MTTVHAYTNDQNLLDLVHKDLRRARAAANNIVPSSTGAARATSLVLPQMKGRFDGSALRVPVQDGSITDFHRQSWAARSPWTKSTRRSRRRQRPGRWPRSWSTPTIPIVSSDIVGSPASCTFDSRADHGHGSLVKVFGWYDNEWGYSNRLVDLTLTVGRAARARSGPL